MDQRGSAAKNTFIRNYLGRSKAERTERFQFFFLRLEIIDQTILWLDTFIPVIGNRVGFVFLFFFSKIHGRRFIVFPFPVAFNEAGINCFPRNIYFISISRNGYFFAHSFDNTVSNNNFTTIDNFAGFRNNLSVFQNKHAWRIVMERIYRIDLGNRDRNKKN